MVSRIRVSLKKLIKMSSCAKVEFLNFRWFRIFNLNVGGLSYFEGERPELDSDGFADDFDLNTAFESYKSVITTYLLKFQFFFVILYFLVFGRKLPKYRFISAS